VNSGAVTMIKDLKVEGSSRVVKVGTIAKHIGLPRVDPFYIRRRLGRSGSRQVLDSSASG